MASNWSMPVSEICMRGRAVALALDDPARGQAARSGRELFEREFTWDAVADRLVNATTEKSIDGRLRMNVAIVIPTEWHASTFTADPRLLSQGFDQLGHNATIVCLSGSTPADGAVVLQVEYRRLTDPAFWRTEGFDLVLVFTWMHSYNDVLVAARLSGAFVVAQWDTDGNYSARAQPMSTLRYAFFSASPVLPRARNIWYWTKRFAYLDREYTRPIVANLQLADATVVETDPAHERVAQILRMRNASHLAAKLHVVPLPIADAFSSVDVAAMRDERLIYSVGRWKAAQKNGKLLASVLRSYLQADDQAVAMVVGRGGAALFGDVRFLAFRRPSTLTSTMSLRSQAKHASS